MDHNSYLSKTGYIAAGTIDMAKQVGYSPAAIQWMKETTDSGKIEDVWMHRGIETYLKKNHGYDSGTYQKNCELIHKWDKKKF